MLTVYNDKQLSISCSVTKDLLGTGIIYVEFMQKDGPTQNIIFILIPTL